MSQKDEPEVAMRKLMEQMPMIAERMKIIAKMQRMKFDALMLEGFTEGQALELCKTVLGETGNAAPQS